MLYKIEENEVTTYSIVYYFKQFISSQQGTRMQGNIVPTILPQESSIMIGPKHDNGSQESEGRQHT